MFGTSKTSVEKHKQSSSNAFKAFQKTVSDLATCNQNIDKDIVKEEEAIRKAQVNKEAMVSIREKNARLVNKINRFFELE